MLQEEWHQNFMLNEKIQPQSAAVDYMTQFVGSCQNRQSYRYEIRC